MEYLALVLGFFAVVVGVRGDTWDRHKTGIRKVTVSGWMALAIALVSTSITGYGIYERVEARKVIETHSRLYVKAALNDVLAPFWALHTKYSVTSGQIDRTQSYRASGLRESFDLTRSRTPILKLEDPDFIKYLQTTDLRQVKTTDIRSIRPGTLTKAIIVEYPSPLESAAASEERGIERIRTLLAIFSDYLDVSVRSALLTIVDPDGFGEALVNRQNARFSSSFMLPKSGPALLNYRNFIDACDQISRLLPDEKTIALKSTQTAVKP